MAGFRDVNDPKVAKLVALAIQLTGNRPEAAGDLALAAMKVMLDDLGGDAAEMFERMAYSIIATVDGDGAGPARGA